MIITKATHRYAKTLFQVSLQQNKLDVIIKDMSFIAKLISSTKGLVSFFKNPIVKSEGVKTLFLSKIQNDIDPLTLKFFNLLLSKNRIHLIPEVPVAFIEYFEQHQNILRATINSVQKLSEEQIEKIREKLKLRTGSSDIHIKNIVDPKLIAGFKIKIGDTIIDANIKNKLSQLKRKLAA